MRRWRGAAGLVPLALLVCLALSGCGSSNYGWNVTCTSATQCNVLLISESGNSDPSLWTVTTDNKQVSISPSHGTIAPGQSVTVKVTLPANSCDIPLIGETHDSTAPLGMGGRTSFAATVPTGSAAHGCPPTPAAP